MVRGDPSTLILERLPIKRTSARAPGPGPLKWSTWQPIAARLLENSNVVLHTDAAKAYQKPIAGVMHTKVVHQKKKVGSKWIKPHFTKRVSIKLRVDRHSSELQAHRPLMVCGPRCGRRPGNFREIFTSSMRWCELFSGAFGTGVVTC